MCQVFILGAMLLFGFMSALSQTIDALTKPVDKSPHTSGFITANGIRLHYLDWGGKGNVLLLLTGFGDEAHVFDEFAPKFTDRFHVIGLTRRGFGESDKPRAGYEPETRVEDIRQFLDALKIQQVSLIGHSMAGDELTLFATLYPQRVRKLVYLDAAINRYGLLEILLTDPGITPGQKKLRLEVTGTPAALQEAAKIVVTNLPPPDVWEIYKAYAKAMWMFRPDYTKVKDPALAFYALSEHHPDITPETDEAKRRQLDDWLVKKLLLFIRRSIEQFRREAPRGHIIEMKNATHYVFVGETSEQVIRQTREFLLQ